MKKIFNNILILLVLGQLTGLNAQYVKTGENTNQYTADASTNHIFTMTKTGGNYNAITINVSLNKAKFRNTNDNSEVGWGTGNAIPGDWDFEITDLSTGSATISGDKKSFTYSGNPPQNVTATIRIFDSSGTLNGLAATTLT